MYRWGHSFPLQEYTTSNLIILKPVPSLGGSEYKGLMAPRKSFWTGNIGLRCLCEDGCVEKQETTLSITVLSQTLLACDQS
jgi:hypothetical protein